MSNLHSRDFGPFDGAIWLNCAHQGPLPRVATEQANEAIAWKTAPYRLKEEYFTEVPQRLKRALGNLINAPAEDVILGNSASYGLHLVANGTRWRQDDEVLVVKGDFPADILPWLGLEERGVRVRLLEPRHHVLQVNELESAATASTRLLCLTWVHSFSGYAADARGLAEACRSRGITLVLNCSQALGTRPLDVSAIPVDAITCVGFKWLCGPYGTGFCWMRPELRESLSYNQAYWQTVLTAKDLMNEQPDLALRPNLGARRYDVFGTANFFNFKPWTAAVEYLLEQGIDRIENENQRLVSRLIAGLDPEKYDILSPRDGPSRSTLVLVSHRDAWRNPSIYEALRKESIYVALRAGKLRLSPHLYNTEDDIDAALAVLRSA